MGAEFTNRKFKRVLHDVGINYYVTFSENNAAVVERFNRTLNTKMWRFFTHSNSYRYIDVLQGLLKGYNSSPHRGIKGRTPDSITAHTTLDVWKENHAQH